MYILRVYAVSRHQGVESKGVHAVRDELTLAILCGTQQSRVLISRICRRSPANLPSRVPVGVEKGERFPAVIALVPRIALVPPPAGSA